MRALLAAFALTACDGGFARVWQSEPFGGCLLASLVRADLAAGPRVIAAAGDGSVVAFDPASGARVWSVALPHPDGEMAHVIATPVVVGPRLVVAWQDVAAGTSDPAAARRSGHFVAVIDLERGVLDEAFPPLALAASVGDVAFAADNALSRARLVHAPGTGLVYVSFGNARDIQPWHGWVFEVDLDAWQVSSVLLTTPETECGVPGSSGSDDMVCGGGVWAPAGPELIPGDDGFELIVPTGNGQLDLARQDYAHTLMRVHGPGLAFDPGCDPLLCAGWDALAPSEACMASCRDLFIPRLPAGTPPFASPRCAGLPFFACYAALDWDLGANAPAPVDLPDGRRVLVLPAKDGGVYLVDGAHLGTLHHRLSVVPECGTDGATCGASWAGMMVTRPEIAVVDGVPLALVATFVWDAVHPAGVVALRVVLRDGQPRLEEAWRAPARDSAEAIQRFRRHPSRIQLVGGGLAAVVDQGVGGQPGTLYLIRVADGAIVARGRLDGPGQRFAQPLAIGDHLFVASCVDGNRGPGHVEAWRLP